MSERQTDAGDPGESAGRKSGLLIIVARGHAELRAAILRALRGLPGLEVIEDRREGGSLLPRPEREPSRASRTSPPDGHPDHPAGPAATLALARAPGSAWPASLSHRV